jgi:hypothetical protein
MRVLRDKEQGEVNVVGVILLVVLVIGIALVLTSILMGTTSALHSSVYIASEAKADEIPQAAGFPVQVLSLFIQEAQPFHFAGQSPPIQGKEVLLKVISPDGRILYPRPFLPGGSLEGHTLYIYPNSSSYSSYCDYIVSETIPAGLLKPLEKGTWVVQLIDTEANLLISSDDRATITSGVTSYPQAGGTAGGDVWRTDCSPLDYTAYGSPSERFTGPPMNMSYVHLDGASWLSYADDPTLKYTGDLTISIWVNPTNIPSPGDYLNSAYWKQVIGKGLQTPSGGGVIEDKNYDLYLIGDRIYFEWDDPGGTHYNIMTDATAVSANNWQYVDLVVQNGVPQILVNGVSQPFTYYQSNVPGQNPIPSGSGPTVNLKDNSDPLTMGKQASTQYPFYYQGDIGSFALYNRGLTQAEIQQNLQTFRA